ncbi:MAG: Bug family tripartite tricarboxylate transporter substrate binding protein [Hyphomicrobiaceae bacterium]
MKLNRHIACGFMALAAIGAGTWAARADEADFYRGKSVNMLIGYSAGGGYDIYARTLARHMARHIPGNPTIVAQNMPGAGSQKAMVYLLDVAAKDGLTFGTFGRTLPLAPLLEGAKYDPSKLEWIGSITSDTSTCVAWHTAAVKTWDDLKTKELTVGGLGKGSDPEMFAKIVKNLFGLNVKLVSGYRGTNEVALAMERGEVEGMCGFSYSSLRASRNNWIVEKKVNILAQAALQKDPAIPASVPLMIDLISDPKKKQALSMILAPQAMARPFAMPPGTPPSRVAAMRKAFMDTMKDEAFLAEAKKTKLDVNPMTGEAMADVLNKAFAMPPDIVAEARRAVGN